MTMSNDRGKGSPTPVPTGSSSRSQNTNRSSTSMSVKRGNSKNNAIPHRNNSTASSVGSTVSYKAIPPPPPPPSLLGRKSPLTPTTPPTDKIFTFTRVVPNASQKASPNQHVSKPVNGNPLSAASSSSVRSSGSSKSGGRNGPRNVYVSNQQSQIISKIDKSSRHHDTGSRLLWSGSLVGTATGSTSLSQQKQLIKLPLPQPISHQRHLSNVFRSAIHLELSRNFRGFVERAMNQHKIFSGSGIHPAIRSALKVRGWIEKPGPLVYSHSVRSTSDAIHQKFDNETDTSWIQRVLRDFPANFLWVNRRDNINWKYLTKDQMINRFPTAWFTTKTGLCASLQHMHWFSEAGVSDTFFPRCYRLSLEEERQAFQDDFRLTACMSYLRHFVFTFQKKGVSALADMHSKITPLSIDFACRQLGTYMRTRRHEDIDWLLTPNFMTQHWDAFIQQYYAVVHENKKLRFDGAESVQAKYEVARKTLRKMSQFWPQAMLDGLLNMWICKPAARSCGSGIVIKNNLEEIMNLTTQNSLRESNWVVQKYIERPLLIFKTKFDIRQWFLLTDWAPLTVWFYKESYVRFCSKPFVLDNFHESIHLCNNAIQCRYQNAPNRDRNLPDDNMWSSDRFQAYLKSINRADAWNVIYSGMKQAIVGVLLASQESVDTRRRNYSCYELFGADFMLTDDFKPWLIEINDRPALDPTTKVTTRLCSQVLEDIVKVVVDRRINRKADTGGFELIYRQNTASVPGYEFSGHELTVVGRRLNRDVDWPMTMSSKPVVASASKSNPSSHVVNPGTSNGNASNVKVAAPPNARHTLSGHIEKLRQQNQEIYQSSSREPQTPG